ncbi:MAG: hypothetical protein HEQ32_03990 [Vampirovibrio sp.]
MTGISHNTVIQWVKHLATEIERLRPEVEEAGIDVELDEMWHFIQKKLKNAGSGWRGTDSKSDALELS